MHITVFGSFCADLTSRSSGLPLPGQSIFGSAFKMGPGGKGSNQAVAAHRAGADVTLIVKIGTDLFSQVAMNLYQAEGMSTEYILRDPEHETGIAVIMVDEVSAQNAIVVVPGTNRQFTPADLEKCRPIIEKSGIVLLQHETNEDARNAVIAMAHQAGATVVVNPAPAAEIPPETMAMIDILTPNETEVQALTGMEVTNAEQALAAAKALQAKGVKKVVITMGSLGAFGYDGERWEMIDRLTVRAVDTTGAGDAFNGGFVTALGEGKDFFTALRYGNVTGALSVTKAGAAPSMPTRAEIDAFYSRNYGC